MRKRTMLWLSIAFSLTAIGCILFLAVMMALKWDFSKLTLNQYVTNTHELQESYQDIAVVCDTADIVFMPSNTSATTVVCYEQANLTHAVTIKDGVLSIAVKDHRKWYEHISVFSFEKPTVTVYIPYDECGKLSIKTTTGDVAIPQNFLFESVKIEGTTGNVTGYASAKGAVSVSISTGDIHIENVSAKMLELAVTTGDVFVSDAVCEDALSVKVSTGKTTIVNSTCHTMRSHGDTGDVHFKNTLVTGNMTVERTTGDVMLESCDAAELRINTSTGDINGSLLTEKVFVTDTSTGDIHVPKTTTGGICELSTSTGDITMTVANNS